MDRTIIDKLVEWQSSAYRKPLILRGARQVGKTWALKEFGRVRYDNVAYFSFDESEELGQFFSTTKNINRILENLTIINKHPILPEKTLIIFDEIQECNPALNSLKYFCENAPEYHVVSAGSLLGIKLEGAFPVGKVDFLDMWPMSFMEFLRAGGDETLTEYILSISNLAHIPEIFFNPLIEKLKIYFITGGMPEAVRAWAMERDVSLVQKVLSGILGAYESDFAKHADRKDRLKISHVWNSVSSQLAKENKKFLYGAVKSGARAREYEDAIDWLTGASLVHKVFRIEKPKLPLSGYDDLSAFKLYMHDVGLLRQHSGLAPSAFSEKNRLFSEFKGALTENFVLQSLKPQLPLPPRYWSQNHPKREVDFVIQHENLVLPVEVKSGGNVGSESLGTYKRIFPEDTPLRVRFSLRNLTLDGDVLNIPLPLADRADSLIRIALS
jgi:predicted AAA+ superfamily ATPase